MTYTPEDIGHNVMVEVTRTSWSGHHMSGHHMVEGLLVKDKSLGFDDEAYYVLTNNYDWKGELCDNLRGYECSWVLSSRGEDYDTIRPIEPIHIKKYIKKHKLCITQEIE